MIEPKFDYTMFSFRTRMKQREVAEKVGASVGLVGNWAIGKAVPSYEKIAGLIEAGITAQELFGNELGEMLIKNSTTIQAVDKEQIKDAVREALADLSKAK